MKQLSILLILVVFSCKPKPEPIPKLMEWSYERTITLGGVNPIGIANANGKLWLSDGDHNRLVQIDNQGNIKQTIDSLDRPMHIDAIEDLLFVPQYGNDKIVTYSKKGRFQLTLKDTLDAPAAIAVKNKEKAIVDFYNNRILYTNGKEEWISFGKEGNAKGEFYYPTDVQVTDTLIWVADAYNNRIQAFNKKGKFVKMLGQDQKMNAATGIYVSKDEVFVTDFENNRVLIFDHKGQLKQKLRKGIAKATDLLVMDEILHIINYRTGELVLYQRKEVKE